MPPPPPPVLLASTWAAHAPAPESVPRYLHAFLGALAATGAPVRVLVRRAEDVGVLGAGRWDAAVAARLDDAPALWRALRGVGAVLWVDDGRELALARNGAALLRAAAEARVPRFVYRAQITSRQARRDFCDALDLLHNRFESFVVIESTPLFVQPVPKSTGGEQLLFALSCPDASTSTSHGALPALAAAEAALLTGPEPAARYDLVSRHCADAGIGNTYFAQHARRRSISGVSRVSGLARRRAPEAEDDQRMHEAWLTFFPPRGRTRPRLSLFGCCASGGATSSEDEVTSADTNSPDTSSSTALKLTRLEEEGVRGSAEKPPLSPTSPGSPPASPRRPEPLASVDFLRAGPWRLELGTTA